jgi:hypothetical protein
VLKLLSRTKVLKRILIIAYLIAFGLLISNRLLLIFDYSIDLGGIEQVFIYYLVLVKNHLNLYSSWQAPPFANNQYSFLYFELLGNFLKFKIFDNYPENLEVYQLARFFNLVFNFISAIIAVKIYNSIFKHSKIVAVLIFLTCFMSFQSVHFATRPDSLKSMFVLIMILFFLKLVLKDGYKLFNSFGFVLFGSLAIYTKQDAILLYGLLCFFGLIYFQRKLWFSISILVLIVIPISYFVAGLYYGEFFVTNFFLPSQFNLSLDYFFLAILRVYWHWFLFIIAIMLAAYLSEKLILNKLAVILGAWVLSTFIISLKWGAGINYYQEIVIISIVLFFGMLDEMNKLKVQKFMYFIPLFLLSADLLQGNIKRYSPEGNRYNKKLYEDSILAAEIITKKTKSASFYLLSYEKQICNQFPQNCLFPSYESNMPELLGNSIVYNIPNVKDIFPSLPEVKNMTSLEDLTSLYKNENLILVISKNVNDDSIYDVSFDKSYLIDSTIHFYIYWKPANNEH